MIARLAVCAAAAASLAGCALLQAADPQDLYTVTPKSSFDPDLPAVYWQLTVEAPAAAANLNTGRIAIAMTPTSSDYYAKAAWTDRAPLMVQTRIVDSFDYTRKIVAVARESIGIRALRDRALSQSVEHRGRHRELPGRQRRLEGALHGGVAGARTSRSASWS